MEVKCDACGSVFRGPAIKALSLPFNGGLTRKDGEYAIYQERQCICGIKVNGSPSMVLVRVGSEDQVIVEYHPRSWSRTSYDVATPVRATASSVFLRVRDKEIRISIKNRREIGGHHRLSNEELAASLEMLRARPLVAP